METLYKATFMNEKHEVFQVHAKSLGNSSILGFIELDELVFLDSSDIIINPEDDKIKKMFKDTKRVYLPINNVIRIDEITVDSTTPVISLYGSGNENT